MHVMFEVFLAPGYTGEGLISEETANDTMAQVMTPDQAQAVGFDGMPDAPDGVEQRFIVVAKADEKRIMSALERSPQVASFSLHEIHL